MIVGELDTVTDFVLYIQRKATLLRSKRAVSATGEEKLLAHYPVTVNDEGEHDFSFPDKATMVVFDEGSWDFFLQRPERKRQIEADEVSYLWDTLIER
ncbi:MAG: hypothetical protein BMS9Abin05_2659 [Rhodothermia bacterium]|nr:MAG: hypothetical protein BMS9Abin05_2659 [Rhodothermia bacterium]